MTILGTELPHTLHRASVVLAPGSQADRKQVHRPSRAPTWDPTGDAVTVIFTESGATESAGGRVVTRQRRGGPLLELRGSFVMYSSFRTTHPPSFEEIGWSFVGCSELW